MWSGERPAEPVGHGPVHIALKEGEEGEPHPRPAAPLVGPCVGQRVVVQEQPRGQVEGHEHVDGVVLMRSKDEEDPEQIQHPGHSVNEIPASWSVCNVHTHTHK